MDLRKRQLKVVVTRACWEAGPVARRFVLHVDMDEFIAAVEGLRRPELEEEPIVVGGDGDPRKRGVVSTASYEARAFGITPRCRSVRRTSGTPRRFLAVDAPRTRGEPQVMDMLRTFHADVEVVGWDEAFMAVTADDPEAFARGVQEAVLERTGLWSTIGIGDNRLQAKLASGFGKPRGVFVLTSDRWDESMFGLPTTELWGIGSKTAAKLAELGIRTVGQLATADGSALAERFGPSTGPWLASLGRGEGSASVHTEGWTAKGLSPRAHVPARPHRSERGRRRGRQDRPRGGERSPPGRAARRPRRGQGAVRPVLHQHPRRNAGRTHRGRRRGGRGRRPRALERFDLDRPVRLVGVRAEMTPPVVRDGA